MTAHLYKYKFLNAHLKNKPKKIFFVKFLYIKKKKWRQNKHYTRITNYSKVLVPTGFIIPWKCLESNCKFMGSLGEEKQPLGHDQVSQAFNELHKFKCHYTNLSVIR